MSANTTFCSDCAAASTWRTEPILHRASPDAAFIPLVIPRQRIAPWQSTRRWWRRLWLRASQRASY
jgi:hypothetical protein